MKAFIIQVSTINSFHKYSFLKECYILWIRKYFCIQWHFWGRNQALTPPCPLPVFAARLSAHQRSWGTGAGGAVESKTSLTQPAAFPLTFWKQQRPTAILATKASAGKSPRADYWINELLKRKMKSRNQRHPEAASGPSSILLKQLLWFQELNWWHGTVCQASRLNVTLD